jgi:hypothetical protein
MMAPDLERLARTPWPIACCASSVANAVLRSLSRDTELRRRRRELLYFACSPSLVLNEIKRFGSPLLMRCGVKPYGAADAERCQWHIAQRSGTCPIWPMLRVQWISSWRCERGPAFLGRDIQSPPCRRPRCEARPLKRRTRFDDSTH